MTDIVNGPSKCLTSGQRSVVDANSMFDHVRKNFLYALAAFFLFTSSNQREDECLIDQTPTHLHHVDCILISMALVSFARPRVEQGEGFFGKFPLELRNKVYHHSLALTNNKFEVCCDCKTNFPNCCTQTAILATCQQVFEEAGAVWERVTGDAEVKLCSAEKYCENKCVDQGWLDSRVLSGRGNSVSHFAVKLEYATGISMDMISTLFPNLETFTVDGITASEVKRSRFFQTPYFAWRPYDFSSLRAPVPWGRFRRWAMDTNFGGFQGLTHLLGTRRGAERTYDVFFDVKNADGKVSISVARTL
jgi:hypothetical protein